MKHKMIIPEMLFQKIKKGDRKVDVRLFEKQYQHITAHDIIEYGSEHSEQTILREVKGIGIFENIYDLVSCLPPEMFGYADKEEIVIRFNRLNSKERQKEFNILVLFIDEILPLMADSIRLPKERF